MTGRGKKWIYLLFGAATIFMPWPEAEGTPGEQSRSPMVGMARVEARGSEPDSRAEIGTAFLVYKSADGAYLVTANHVIENAATIFIRFAIAPDAPPSEARVVAVNEALDLAVLLASKFPPDIESLPLQLARLPSLGDPLFLIGYSVSSRSPAVRNSAMSQSEGADFLLQTQVDDMDSGSPLIFQGGIAGLVKAKDGAYARCAPSSVLAKALEGWQIPFASVPLPTPPAEVPPPAVPPATTAQQMAQMPRAPIPSNGSTCIAQVVSQTGGSQKVYQSPSGMAPTTGSLTEGTRVAVLGPQYNENKVWFRIAVSQRQIYGFLPQSNLNFFAGNCSSRR